MTTLTTLQIPTTYGYVLLTAATTHLLSIWHGTRIAPFRHAAHVPHPYCSASAETIASAPKPQEKRALYLFNCAQRAHYNFLENYTAALSALLLAGLRYPRLAATAGALWCLGRVVYALGYTSQGEGNVEGRGRWAYGGFYVAAVSQVGLMGLVGWMGIELLRA